MTLYHQIPTFYRATWNNSGPTNYSSVGSISPFNSIQMNNMISVTNTNAAPTFTNGDVLLCNDVQIGPFSNAFTISNVVTAFNNMTQFTGVMASQSFPGYITLQSIDPPEQPIALSDLSGSPLEELGLTQVSGYKHGNPIYSGAFGSPSVGANVIINGTTVVFSGSNISSITTNINQSSMVTNVVAVPSGGNLQLNTLDGSPIYFGQGSSGASAAIGFSDNMAYGGAMTYASAVQIEQANMLWKNIINNVESIVSPIYWGSIAITGNNTTDGSTLPTTVSWTIGISDPAALVTATLVGEPETVGTLLYGTAALTRLIARGLVTSYTENRKVYNNTITIRGSYALRENPVVIANLTAPALDISSNIHLIEGNLAVTVIGNA